jgi:PTS system nitrogen regulatory IIA component
MNFRKVLKNGCYCLNLKGETKQEIIEEMIDILAEAGKIADRGQTLDAVMERERKMSTGMQFGVAIPHGKTDGVSELVTAVGVKKEGIDFGSLDGQPSTIFIMTISPVNRTGPHIQYLSEISKLLTQASIRSKLLEAQTPDALIELLTD